MSIMRTVRKAPLAARIRPDSLDEFVGQEHVVGSGKPLRIAIERKHPFSFIVWGPPGCGKTTLARIYARSLGAQFFELSAVSAGKQDIRTIIEGNTRTRTAKSSAPKHVEHSVSAHTAGTGSIVVFLDEIHRFNKAQQDYLLPYVEDGTITLIGATTENPSFEVIAPLLSRCRVFTLRELTDAEIGRIIDRTGFALDREAKEWLIAMANGDARQAITMVENADRLYGTVTKKSLIEVLQSKFLRYDKKGEEHYNTISAFIKSMRASQPDAALYYLARMIDAGEDPTFIARRMVIFASEDVGLAQPTALVVANAVFRAVETIGYPECAINLAHGAAYLARCPKDRRAYNALRAAQKDVQRHGNLPIPLTIRNAPTNLMKELEYGKEYEHYTKESLLPEQLRQKEYTQSGTTHTHERK